MSHNEEHTRCQLIGACAASAQRAMDAAAVELDRAGDHEALEMVSQARQHLGAIERKYPCDVGKGKGQDGNAG